jgi:hypothetical protein
MFCAKINNPIQHQQRKIALVVAGQFMQGIRAVEQTPTCYVTIHSLISTQVAEIFCAGKRQTSVSDFFTLLNRRLPKSYLIEHFLISIPV